MDEKVAKRIGDKIGIDWSKVDLNEFAAGLDEEFEHGSRDPETNVTNDDPLLTGKIAWAHLKEDPKYYSKLEKAMKMNTRAKALKMVARKGIASQVPRVINVRKFVQGLQSNNEAGRLITNEQFLKLSSGIAGLDSIGRLLEQAEASANGSGRGKPYSGDSWSNSVQDAAKLARYAASYSSAEKVSQYGKDKMVNAQKGWLRSIDSKLEYLVSDIKRNASNNAGTFRHQ